MANSIDPDQTASSHFTILAVLLDIPKGNQTDLVKFYVNYGAKSKYIWKLWHNFTKKKKKKKKK